jgi:hypothetical protein
LEIKQGCPESVDQSMPADRIYLKNLFNITNSSTYFDTEILSVFEPRVLNVQSILYSSISSPQWCLAEIASFNKSELKKDILAKEEVQAS